MRHLLIITRAAAVAALLVGALSATAAFAQTEDVYLVHGIPGFDVGQADELPVDIAVDGACAVDDFMFGDVVGPVPIDAGARDIAVYLSDGVDATCTGAKVIELLAVPFLDGETSTIVAHLTQTGAPGAGDQLNLGITASKFALDLSAPGRGEGRLIAHHTALAPDVDVDLSRGRSPGVTVDGFEWGTQLPAPLRAGNWRLQLRATGTELVAYGPEKARIKPYQAFVVFAVGTALSSTFDVIGFRVPTALK